LRFGLRPGLRFGLRPGLRFGSYSRHRVYPKSKSLTPPDS